MIFRVIRVFFVILLLSLQLDAAVGTIQTHELHQTLKGFGASVAWYGNWVTEHPNKDLIYYYMFEELGLDILRLRNTYRGNPNNFAPETTIEYTIPEAGSVTLRILDIRGREVLLLTCGHHESGRYSTSWNGLNHAGVPVGSGVYFIELEQGSHHVIHKITRLN